MTILNQLTVPNMILIAGFILLLIMTFSKKMALRLTGLLFIIALMLGYQQLTATPKMASKTSVEKFNKDKKNYQKEYKKLVQDQQKLHKAQKELESKTKSTNHKTTQYDKQLNKLNDSMSNDSSFQPIKVDSNEKTIIKTFNDHATIVYVDKNGQLKNKDVKSFVINADEIYGGIYYVKETTDSKNNQDHSTISSSSSNDSQKQSSSESKITQSDKN